MSLTSRVMRVPAAAALACAAALTLAAAPAAPAGPGAAVPTGFKANSVTWLSARRGWVLGAAPCGTRTCAGVIATTDGATTWHLAGAVGAPIATPARAGVTEIRFATVTTGWAFGPDLFRTTNGGKTWTKAAIPGGGKQVLALAASATQAYAVASGCAWGSPCPRPLSIWRTRTGSTNGWTRIPLTLPPTSNAVGVAVSGATVYVLDAQSHTGRPDAFYASTDGVHFTARRAPCAHSKDLVLIQAVPMSATRVALLCDGNPGHPSSGDATKTVYTSANTGHTDTYAGQTGPPGFAEQLAASPSGNLAVAAASGASFIYINDTHRRAWTLTTAVSDGGGEAWNDFTYVTNTQAWVVYGPAGSAGPGQLWVTHDAGRHWSIAKL